tara:strand:+ start:1790 stop:2299 length:510 start_codon:yes stop_codon:yes gene_type:complete
MISFKKYFQIYFFVIFCSIFLNISSIADDDTEEKNLLDQTKEVVEELGKKEKANTSLDLEKDEFDEDVPLVNPFVAGDTEGTKLKTFQSDSGEDLSIANLKLVGVATGSYRSFATFADETGEMFTLEVSEQLSGGLMLVGVMLNEAIFKHEDKLIVINFKNEIFERAIE